MSSSLTTLSNKFQLRERALTFPLLAISFTWEQSLSDHSVPSSNCPLLTFCSNKYTLSSSILPFGVSNWQETVSVAGFETMETLFTVSKYCARVASWWRNCIFIKVKLAHFSHSMNGVNSTFSLWMTNYVYWNTAELGGNRAFQKMTKWIQLQSNFAIFYRFKGRIHPKTIDIFFCGTQM